MFNSRFLVFLLLPLSVASLWAQQTAETPSPLSDAEVVQRLSTTDVLAWERAMSLKKEGQSLVDSGNILQARKVSAFRTAADIAQDKKDGAAMVALGESKIAEAESKLQALRDMVVRKQQNTTAVTASQEYKLKVQTENFDKALAAMTEQLLFTLWDQGYRRIFLVDSWVNRNGELESTPDITEATFDLMRQYDGTRYSVIPSTDKNFAYRSFGSTTEVTFDEKDRLLSDYKVAIVYLEIIPSLDNGEALISLRAVDAETLKIIDAQLRLSPVNTALASVLGSPTEQATTKVAPIFVTLTDDNNLVERIAAVEPSYKFGYRYMGNANSYRSQRANLILKSLMLPSGVELYDHDFLMLAIGSEDPIEDNATPSTAIWQLEPSEPGNPPIQSFKLEAVSIKDNQEIPVTIGQLELITQGAEKEAS